MEIPMDDLQQLEKGLILTRLKRIERELMSIYAEMQKEIPGLHNLSFEISTWENGKTVQHGYYHIGKGCKPYNNIAELATLITGTKERRAKNEILYQRFGRIS